MYKGLSPAAAFVVAAQETAARSARATQNWNLWYLLLEGVQMCWMAKLEQRKYYGSGFVPEVSRGLMASYRAGSHVCNLCKGQHDRYSGRDDHTADWPSKKHRKSSAGMSYFRLRHSYFSCTL